MTSALVGVCLREETHSYEFGSPPLLLLNRTREVRFMLLVVHLFRVVLLLCWLFYLYSPFPLVGSADSAEGWTDRVFCQACTCMFRVVIEWFRKVTFKFVKRPSPIANHPIANIAQLTKSPKAIVRVSSGYLRGEDYVGGDRQTTQLLLRKTTLPMLRQRGIDWIDYQGHHHQSGCGGW